MSRTEDKIEEAEYRSYRNAKSILDFCLDNGLSEGESIAFSTCGIQYSDFIWYFQESEEDIDELKIMVNRRLARVEANRRASLFSEV
jgi:hypothetical protein